MKIFFTTLAQKELQDAVYFYDETASALGDELLREVEQAKKNILAFPLAWSSAGKEQRRYVLQRFPYLLIYKVYCDRIVVAAFAHQHRLPENTKIETGDDSAVEGRPRLRPGGYAGLAASSRPHV